MRNLCGLIFLLQLVPFAVAWAKDAMVQVIKGQFLMRDEGDGVNVTSDLQEDTEPPPATIDSWAQGCVPVIRILNPLEVTECTL